MPRRPFAATLAACLTAVAAVASSGCSEPPPKPADPAQTRQFLSSALDAWKEGGKPADLTSKTPPVHVLDRDWSGGAKVTEYKVEDGKPLGAGVQFPVSLTLQTAEGKTATKRVVYVVNTGDVVSIARQDMDF